MENFKLILTLLVAAAVLALYTMNTATWPYLKGFQVKFSLLFIK
jgi:hypothetical protein